MTLRRTHSNQHIRRARATLTYHCRGVAGGGFGPALFDSKGSESDAEDKILTNADPGQSSFRRVPEHGLGGNHPAYRGRYPVYADIDDHGRTKAVKVVFDVQQ